VADQLHDNNPQYEIAAPNPAALIESLRAFGYDLCTAISDLIDNSIAAASSNIWIDANWSGSRTTICVTDDGHGMDRETLLDAMRPGSKSPREVREAADLGRFGLGLKTASFSQARKTTVRSKTRRNEVSQFCWDLDYVTECGEWRVLTQSNAGVDELLNRLLQLPSGTSVLWESLDRLVAGDDKDDLKAQDLFLARLEELRSHIAMVFHRFLRGRQSLRIHINDRPIQPWDPFLENHQATQRQPQEVLEVAGVQVLVTPFVLPHHSKLTPVEHSGAGGPRGWNSHQGYYIYRNRRLLVSGDWLGLGFQKEEHYKLARIQIDIPNSLDEEWDIDVRKARANPPKAIRSDLKRIAKLVRQAASEIYRHRGKLIARKSSSSDMFMWLHKRKHGKQFYKINREHPLVVDALDPQSNGKKSVQVLLRCLEETVPIPLIVINQAEDPDTQSIPFEGAPAKEVLTVMEQLLESLLRSGLPLKSALDRLSVMEPFDRYPELVAVLRENLENSQ
jgi:hypothetical protein